MSKTIVITGAGAGLGRSLSKNFAKDGDTVVLLGRTLAKVEQLVSEIGDGALAIGCDVGNPDSVRQAFAEIAKSHAKIDVLINNATVNDYSTLADASDEHILGTVGTNLTGTLLCSRSALGMMDRGGHIINVSSESVEAYFPMHLVYQATKAGVEVMSRHLQTEVSSRGIRISVVRAGAMMGEDRTVHSTPEATAAFYAACAERGIQLATNPISRYDSAYWIFRSLVDMPADIQVGTVHFTARHP